MDQDDGQKSLRLLEAWLTSGRYIGAWLTSMKKKRGFSLVLDLKGLEVLKLHHEDP